MQLGEAISYLNQQLSLACLGDAPGMAERSVQPPEPHSLLGKMSDTLSKSEVDIRRDEASHPSIQTFNASRQEPIHGQQVYIKLAGDVQPEAARVLDHILTPMLNKLHISEETVHRGFPNGVGDAERAIRFNVSEERAGDLVAHIVDLANQIKQDPRMRKQVRNGIELSIDYINRIEGGRVKPHLMLVPRQADFDRDEPKVRSAYFKLLMQNVPVGLAHQLAEVSGQDFDSLLTSKSSHDRTGRKEFQGGGKNFEIAMNDPKIGAVIDKIKNYVRLQQEFGIGGPDAGRSGPG